MAMAVQAEQSFGVCAAGTGDTNVPGQPEECGFRMAKELPEQKPRPGSKEGAPSSRKPSNQSTEQQSRKGGKSPDSTSARFDQAIESGRKERYEEQFFKTKVCSFWKRGQCNRGRECKYAHGAREVRVAPDLHKTSKCVTMSKTGQCTRQDCPFAHSADELRGTDRFFKTTMCTFFTKRGECWLGDKCRHAHSLNELRKASHVSEFERGPAAGGRQPFSRRLRERPSANATQGGWEGLSQRSFPEQQEVQSEPGDNSDDDLEDLPETAWGRASTAPATVSRDIPVPSVATPVKNTQPSPATQQANQKNVDVPLLIKSFKSFGVKKNVDNQKNESLGRVPEHQRMGVFDDQDDVDLDPNTGWSRASTEPCQMSNTEDWSRASTEACRMSNTEHHQVNATSEQASVLCQQESSLADSGGDGIESDDDLDDIAEISTGWGRSMTAPSRMDQASSSSKGPKWADVRDDSDDDIEDMSTGWGRAHTAPVQTIGVEQAPPQMPRSFATDDHINMRRGGHFATDDHINMRRAGHFANPTSNVLASSMSVPCGWNRPPRAPIRPPSGASMVGAPLIMAVPVMVVPVQPAVVPADAGKQQGSAASSGQLPQHMPIPSVVPQTCNELTARFLQDAMPDRYED